MTDGTPPGSAPTERPHPGDLLPTLDARERLHAWMDGRWGGRRRSFRDAGREIGVSYNTLNRFSAGKEVSGRVLDAICAAIPHSSNLRNRRDPTGHEPRKGIRDD